MPWRLLFLAAASVVVTASLPQADGGVRTATNCVQQSEEIVGITSLGSTLAVANKTRATIHNIAGPRQQCRKIDEIDFPAPVVDKFTEFKLLNTSSLFYCDNTKCTYCRFGTVHFCRELSISTDKKDIEISTAAATQTGNGNKILVKIVFTSQNSILFAFEEPLLEESSIVSVSRAVDVSFLSRQQVALGFNAGGFSYFVTSAFQPYEPNSGAKDERRDPSYQVKIMRICDSDTTDLLETRVDIQLACPGIDESNSRGVAAATYSPAEKKMVIIFSTNSTNDVACSYPLNLVNEQVNRTWNICQNTTFNMSNLCKSSVEKVPENCYIFTRMSDHGRTYPCVKYAGDMDEGSRVYAMCDIKDYKSTAYRFGWLESYIQLKGTPIALIDNRGHKYTRVFIDEWHSSLFLTGDDRWARVPASFGGEKKNEKSAPPAIMKFYKPSSRFALANVSPSSFLLIDHDHVEEHEISCASLYRSCEDLAKGGFSDSLQCLFCAMPDNGSGGYVMDRIEKNSCKLPLFETCPPVISEAKQNPVRKGEWIITGESLQTLNNPIVRVCEQPCRINFDTAGEKSLTCTLQSSSVIDSTCKVKLEGVLEAYQAFSVSPVPQSKDSSTQIGGPLDINKLESSPSTMPKSLKIVIGVVVVILIIAIIIIIILGARKYLGMRNQKGNGSNGMMFPLENQYQRNAARNTYLSTDPSGMPFANNTSPAHAPAYERLFREIDSRLKIPSDHLILEKQIGKGHFGVVIKGSYNPPDGPTRAVACKTLTAHVAGGISEFVNEGLMMDRFDHPRVMTLVGISFNEDRMPIIVTDYMENGDLAKYLRDVKNKPTLRDLLNFTHEIAQGMQYLHDNKFIHRDLAARNCMLDRNIHVKIADFGLCREATSQDEYLPVHSGREMPLRWMAPEALEREQFTMAGDVWAFGIVIWEVMTRGMNPYPNLQAYVLFEFLKAGKRMGKPDFCPDILFRVMLDCWHGEPTLRPTFKDLPDQIEEIIDVLSSNSRVQMNAEYEQCNSVRNSRAASSSATTPITHHAISHVHSLPMDQSPDPTPV